MTLPRVVKVGKSVTAAVLAAWIALTILASAAERKTVDRPAASSHVARPTHMTTVTTTWQSGGFTHEVTTTMLDGETADAFAGRHKSVVDALKAIYPPS